MPKPSYPQELKAREGKQVNDALAAFNAARPRQEKATQEHLADELGVTQGVVHQWLNGKTRIPDLTLLQLGKMLNFDAISVRPTLAEYGKFFAKESLLDGLSPEDQARLRAVALAFKESIDKNTSEL